MAGRKSEQKDRAKELFIKSRGAKTPREIAEQLGVKPELVRKWKYRDKWDEELKKPRRGAPVGSKNAKGHGAPKNNTNSVTHGAYAKPRLELLSPAELEEIDALRESFTGNALRMLKRLELKRADLERRISELSGMDEDSADLLDRKMTMITGSGDSAEYLYKSSPFTRRMLLEGELNRLDGRILKLMDSIKSLEAEQKRIEIERERLEFTKQKIRGVFNLDDAGTVLPDEDEGDEIIET